MYRQSSDENEGWFYDRHPSHLWYNLSIAYIKHCVKTLKVKFKWVRACQVASFVSLCHPMDCSPPGSSVHGILQASILEGVDMPFSRGSSWPRYQTQVSRIAGRFFTVWARWCSSEEFACQLRRHWFNPGSGRSSGVGNGNLLQYSCLENSMDRKVWWAIKMELREFLKALGIQ